VWKVRTDDNIIRKTWSWIMLFSLMFWSGHCLHTLLPDLKIIDFVLHSSGTSFNLLHCSYKLYKQSFVNRCLFRDCYWHVLLCFACFTKCETCMFHILWNMHVSQMWITNVKHFVFHILFVYYTYYLIWFDIIFSIIIGWRLSVLINNMFMLCFKC